MAKNPKKVRQQLKKAAASVRRVSVRPKAEQGRKGKAKPAAKPAKRDTIQVDAVDQAKTHVDELRNDAVVSDAPATSRCPILPIPEVVETEEISVSVEVPAITAPPPAATQTRTAPMLPPSNPQEERRPGETLRSPGPSSTLLAPQRLPAEARKPKAPSFNWGSASVVVGSVAVAVFFAVELSRPTSGTMVDTALAQLEADDTPPTQRSKEPVIATIDVSVPFTEMECAAELTEDGFSWPSKDVAEKHIPNTSKMAETKSSKPKKATTNSETAPWEPPPTKDERESALVRAKQRLYDATTMKEIRVAEAALRAGMKPPVRSGSDDAALRIAVGRILKKEPIMSNSDRLDGLVEKIVSSTDHGLVVH